MQHSEVYHQVLTCSRPRPRLTFSLVRLPAVLPHLYNPRPGTFRPQPSASPGQNKTDYQINGDRMLQGVQAASSGNSVSRIIQFFCGAFMDFERLFLNQKVRSGTLNGVPPRVFMFLDGI